MLGLYLVIFTRKIILRAMGALAESVPSLFLAVQVIPQMSQQKSIVL